MGRVAASTDVFRAVADPTRRAMLDLLLGTDRTVGELAERFRISQPAISQHLRVLREAGLVRPRRAGRQRLYRLDPRPVDAVYAWSERFRRVQDPSGHIWSLRAGLQPVVRPPAPRASRSRPSGRRVRPRRGGTSEHR